MVPTFGIEPNSETYQVPASISNALSEYAEDAEASSEVPRTSWYVNVIGAGNRIRTDTIWLEAKRAKPLNTIPALVGFSL